MLKIINNMRPFFEDCYSRIGVREYARLMLITPPTASSLLKTYEKEGLLLKEKDRNYILFYANNDSNAFIILSRLYWQHVLSELTSYIEANTINPTVILFGSLSKGEAKQDSDIDIAIFASKKTLDFAVFEKKLKRKIQIFWHISINEIGSKELANSIINGHILAGRIVV